LVCLLRSTSVSRSVLESKRSNPRYLARAWERRRRCVVVEEEYWVFLFLWCSKGLEKWPRNLFWNQNCKWEIRVCTYVKLWSSEGCRDSDD
jgi:hypothetical protein